MDRERGAVESAQVGNHSQANAKRFGAPLSRFADGPRRITGVEAISGDSSSCHVAVRGRGMGCWPSPDVTHPVQAPVPFWRPWTRYWNSEASREERGRLITDLGPVGGGE